MATKTIYLMRHGIAEPGLGKDDSDRALTDAGVAGLRGTVQGLQATGLHFDVILCSPYRRAHQTADLMRPFIAEHHGTTLVEYFYHAANRQRKPDEREIADSAYRYPGPKPQSRETAIVMLADGVEGAVRAMSEPTPGRIEDVVSEIVQKRLMDGQFDECDLTFLDLAAIQKSLVKTLAGIYHARIVYPESEESEEPERQTPARSAS